MKDISELIFRQITPADFFNINKQPGAEERGGGQSYIDVSTRDVSLDEWRIFFDRYQPENARNGPLWNAQINSIGNLGNQTVAIGQRRDASVNIRAQKLFSRQSNRIFAWHPDHGGFPRPPMDMSSAEDPRVIELSAGLRVFLIKTVDNDYWAGWLKTEEIERCVALDNRFEPMLNKSAGRLVFDPTVQLDEANLDRPFIFPEVGEIVAGPILVAELDLEKAAENPHRKERKVYNSKAGKSEAEIAESLFSDDFSKEEVKKTEKVVKTFERNRKAVRELKKLYKSCQISGDTYVFAKANGEPYLEVHHLIPLGEGGADEPSNLVVLSAHIHRMLHYSEVEGIDLSLIADNKLDLKINGELYTITWNPEHARLIRESN